MSLISFLKNKLQDLHKKDLYRSLKIYDENLLDFSSNDYLALSNQKFDFSNLKSGSTGSRLITGNSADLESLEKEIASWKNTEAALFFG